MRKLSLIATTLNEEDNINKFLDSILKQSIRPNEFIIVDGGSTDKTYSILKRYSKRYKWIKCFKLNGTNISKGRNYAIKKAKNNIIVGSDAGTKYKKDWLENLLGGFDEGVGFGKTLALAESKFQRILSKKMKQKFGSSRNIIFEKKIWKEVGGYPEDLDIAEDTVFNEKIRQRGYKIIYIPNAIGYWEMRKSFPEVKKQFYRYGYWDGVAYKKYRMLPVKSKILILGLTILSPFYPLLWVASKTSLSIKIDVMKRFAYLIGFWRGFTKR